MGRGSIARRCSLCGSILKKANEGSICPKCVAMRVEKNLVAIDINTAGCNLRLKVRDNDEAEDVKVMANDYDEIDFEIPDASALLEVLLTLRLETKRLQAKLCDREVRGKERKETTKQLNDITSEIRSTQKTLGITRGEITKRRSSPVETFTDMAEELAKWEVDNKHIFQGIAKCSKCKERIIFEGFMPTLEGWLTLEIEELLKKEDSEQVDRQVGEQVINKKKIKEEMFEQIKEIFKKLADTEVYTELHRKNSENTYG